MLKRRGQSPAIIAENLHDIFRDFLILNNDDLQCMRVNARAVACRANWKDFFRIYEEAYDRSLSASQLRAEKFAGVDLRAEMKHTFSGAVSVSPHFRTFTAVANLPAKISRLRELAHNLWWAWNPMARELFSALDPKLWAGMGNNPVRMLETVSSERLVEASDNASYLNLYRQIFRQFDEYMNDKTPSPLIGPLNGLKWSQPVAYFSTEYGLHDCLPIYSGGLGTLSGDHLKTASDLNIPLVGVGLLYKNGFFKQVIDRNGNQVAEYPENDFSSMPLEIVQDDRGNAVQISRSSPTSGRFMWGASHSTSWTPTSRGIPFRTGRSPNASTAPNRGRGSNKRSSSEWGASGFSRSWEFPPASITSTRDIRPFCCSSGSDR
jgi:phosphorylase/glycogen(starch) synthase